MQPQVTRITGFAAVCFSFAFLIGVLLLQAYTGIWSLRLLAPLLLLCVTVMIRGLHMMTGKKPGLSYDFGKPRSRLKWPQWLGPLLTSYVVIGSIIIFCVFLAVFVTHSIVQRLFVLLAGNTIVCVLLYLRFDNERPYIDSR
ncbi:MAG: hypothetical protein HXS52_09980 [Theionarchaea archaeon]|nr:hypothetical protein [Theionarchaea archaeon]MBU7038253.1 hypothetical protein [Theionarchaea archaeon]